MVFETLIEMAKDESTTDGLKLHELSAYQGIRFILERYQNGFISKEVANKEKDKLRAEYEKEKQAFESARKYMEFHAKLFKEIESAGIDFMKDKTVENAIRFHDVVYGLR